MTSELAEAMEPNIGEAIKWMREYYALKKYQAIIDANGETIQRGKADRHEKRLNTALKEWIKTNGPLEAEGLPTLFMKPRRIRWYDIRAMRRDNPALFETFIDFLKPDQSMIDGARALYETTNGVQGLPSLKQWEHEGETLALTFEEER